MHSLHFLLWSIQTALLFPNMLNDHCNQMFSLPVFQSSQPMPNSSRETGTQNTIVTQTYQEYPNPLGSLALPSMICKNCLLSLQNRTLQVSYSLHFTFTNLFNFHYDPIRYKPLLSSSYREEDKGPGKLPNIRPHSQ